MASVIFTRHLIRYFPDLQDADFEGEDLLSVIQTIEQQHPGFSEYIVDEQGRLRKHVNIFIDSEPITDRVHLSDQITPQSTIHFIQALSGG